MDEFGVLTEVYGLKPQGKSAPMSAARRDSISASSSSSPAGSYFNSAQPSSTYDIFGSSGGMRTSSIDPFDSVFSSSKSSSVIGGGNSADDIFGSFVSTSKQESSKPLVGDLLGDFETPKTNTPPMSTTGSSDGFDDLFSGVRSSYSNGDTSKSSNVSTEDPFVVLESAARFTPNRQPGGVKNTDVSSKLRPPPMPGKILKPDKVKSSLESSIDELQDFAMGRSVSKDSKERRGPKATKYKEAEEASQNLKHDFPDDLLSNFGGSRSVSAPRSRVTTPDILFDYDTSTNSRTESIQKKPSGNFFSFDESYSTANAGDDLYSMLGDSSFFGTSFEDIQGESDERRKARLERMQRTHDRMAKAVADMNKRDSKIQHEQEERRRIAEQMDVVIKRWATGKEGNLRALLASLQQVLWPECGWEAVSLTDIVTSASVKKVYRKATLCVHPDKVQQKGSTLHEKYIAEKVFDILKEAWNKFNRDER